MLNTSMPQESSIDIHLEFLKRRCYYLLYNPCAILLQLRGKFLEVLPRVFLDGQTNGLSVKGSDRASLAMHFLFFNNSVSIS